MINCRPLCADCAVILVHRLTPVKHPINVVDFALYKALKIATKEISEILDRLAIRR